MHTTFSHYMQSSSHLSSTYAHFKNLGTNLTPHFSLSFFINSCSLEHVLTYGGS